MRQKILRKMGPILLSALSCAGVIGMGIMSAKATEKRLSENTSETKPAWQYYVPTGAVGVLTIGCIVGAHILNRKQQALLLAGQLAIAQSYAEYKGAIHDRYGEETAIEIEKEIAVQKCKKTHLYANTITGSTTLEPDIPSLETPMTFQETMGGVIFESTLSKVIEAEYHLNRNFVLSGEATLKEFYDFLGLYSEPEDDEIGWSVDDEFYWVDFDHRMGRLENGEIGCIIDSYLSPDRNCILGVYSAIE